jgi:hypothetical protein
MGPNGRPEEREMRNRAIWFVLTGLAAFIVARQASRLGAGRGRKELAGRRAAADAKVTEELEETFPASDPPSHTATSGSLAR